MFPSYLWIPGFLFFLLLIIIHLGRAHGARIPRDTDPKPGVATINTLLFSLLSLLLAFTLSDANSRLAERRQLIAREAAAIRVVNLRLGILPAETHPALREALERYAVARSSYGAIGGNAAELTESYAVARTLQTQFWQELYTVKRKYPDSSWDVGYVLNASEDMIQVAASRHAAAFSHVPNLVYFLIITLACGSAYLAGRALRDGFREQLGYRFTFCAVIALTVYTICDLDNPREGLIRLDRIDQAFESATELPPIGNPNDMVGPPPP